MALLANFEVTKVTLHYILPNICERPPPAKSKRMFEALIDKLTSIDGGGLFQEAIGRARQKNTVVILHNMEILAKLLADGRITVPEVKIDYKAITRNIKKIGYFGRPQ
jgi:ribosomal protein L15